MKKHINQFLILMVVALSNVTFASSNPENTTPLKNNASVHNINTADSIKNLNLYIEDLESQNKKLYIEIKKLKAEHSLSKLTVEKLEGNLNAKPSREEFDLLSKTFFERLRTTDDSISLWGILATIIGVLCTLILAAMAFLHFGRINELTKKTEKSVSESRNEAQMAVNAAIAHAGNRAEKIIEEWIKDKGEERLEPIIKQAESRLGKIDGTLESANNKMQSLSEISISDSSIHSPQNHNSDITGFWLKLPSQLDFETIKNTIVKCLDIQADWMAYKVAKSVHIDSFEDEQRLALIHYQIFCYAKVGHYSTVSKIYLTNLDIFLNKDNLIKLERLVNTTYTTHCIVYSLYRSNHYDQARELFNFLLTIILENKFEYNGMAKLLRCIDEFDKSLFQESLAKVNSTYDENSSIHHDLLELNSKNNTEYKKSKTIEKEQLVSTSTSPAQVLTSYINITHHYFVVRNWPALLSEFEEVKSLVNNETKKILFDYYSVILLNRAYALFKVGAKRKAYRIIRHIENSYRSKKNHSPILQLDEFQEIKKHYLKTNKRKSIIL